MRAPFRPSDLKEAAPLELPEAVALAEELERVDETAREVPLEAPAVEAADEVTATVPVGRPV